MLGGRANVIVSAYVFRAAFRAYFDIHYVLSAPWNFAWRYKKAVKTFVTIYCGCTIGKCAIRDLYNGKQDKSK